MASSFKQSDPRDRLIPLPKYSPGKEPSFYGWSHQVETLLYLANATEQVKLASVLNAIPAEILTKVFQKEDVIKMSVPGIWSKVLNDLREYFKNHTEIYFYNTLRASTKWLCSSLNIDFVLSTVNFITILQSVNKC